MKITMIAGHGAGDPGCSGTINGKIYREADEARILVPLIAAELQRCGVDVVIRDPSRNAYADEQAGQLVFPAGVKYLLEVHFNAVAKGQKPDGKTKGVECYVTKNESGVTVEQGICAAIAAFGLANRGVKRKNFNVIARAKARGISAALLEVCFLDDPDDLAIYVARRGEIAVAIARAICEGFGIELPKETDREIVQRCYEFNDETMNFFDGHRFPAALYDRMARMAEKAMK